MATNVQSATTVPAIPWSRMRRRIGRSAGSVGWLLFAALTVWLLAERAAASRQDVPVSGAVRGSVATGGVAAASVGEPSVTAGGLAEPRADRVPFVSHGLAITRIGTSLYDHPARGTAVLGLAPGTRLDVGGVIEVPSGLWRRRVLWVRVERDGLGLYGFVPGDAAIVSIGEPPRIDTSAVGVAQLLAPTELGAASLDLPAGGSVPLAAGPVTDGSEITIPWLPDTVTRWREPIVAAAREHGVDPNLVAIVVLVESGGDPGAVSPSGALGLMQVMPATAADIAARRGIGDHGVERLMSPAYNIDFGTWYLAEMLSSFGSPDDPDWQQSVELAASAYNGGPGSVQRMLTAGADLPSESARYRRWVGAMWSERDLAASAGFESWMAAGGAALVGSARASRAGT